MDTRRISHGNPYSDSLSHFIDGRHPAEIEWERKFREALRSGNFDEVNQAQAIQPAYGPEDMLAGGVAGTMLAPTKGLARFLFEAGIDPLYEAAIQNSRLDDSYLAMATGKRGLDNLINVWHRTSPESAKSIRDSGKFTPKEDGIFFTDKIDGPASLGYGDDAVEFSIPEARLQIDDEFPDGERHFRFPAKQGKEIDISDFIVRNDSGKALSYNSDMNARDVKAKILREIRAAARDGNENIGVRVFHPDQKASKGDALPSSYTWDDGDILLDEPLDGLAAFRVYDGARGKIEKKVLDEALAYSVGGGGQSLGVVVGDGLLDHAMPEYGAGLFAEPILYSDLISRDPLNGAYNNRTLSEILKKK